MPGRPLYGLEADGDAATLEGLAARYAGAIVRLHPEGSCCLGGWSFGGLVAWETAHRLRSLGREVALLVLLDSRPDARLQAMGGYSPQPLDCPVALFLAEDRLEGDTADLAALWRPLASGGLEVETLPGDHFSLLAAPAVDVLAERLLERLARAGARA